MDQTTKICKSSCHTTLGFKKYFDWKTRYLENTCLESTKLAAEAVSNQKLNTLRLDEAHFAFYAYVNKSN
ncbi:hypothetical protein VVMO6_03944 [Vibrio vulnificus MO6-24/O]|nr:hypothetical protein VVMO6_03944 [Vibrio vulnificus MO6-24/O]